MDSDLHEHKWQVLGSPPQGAVCSCGVARAPTATEWLDAFEKAKVPLAQSLADAEARLLKALNDSAIMFA